MNICLYFINFFVLFTSASKVIIQDQYGSDGSAIAEVLAYSKLQLKRVVMISKEVEEVPYASRIIKALSSPVIINSIISHNPGYEDTFIVFSNKRYFYYKLLKHVKVADKVRVLIMWKWPSGSVGNKVKNIMVTLQDILTVMWVHQIYDVYILVEDEHSDVKIYTYSPFGKTHCNKVGPPLLVDTWDSTTKRLKMNKFRIENTKFDTRHQLMKNLHGCPIKVLVKNRPPESVALMTSDNKLILNGSGGNILAYMMKKYNFTIKIKHAEDGLHPSTRDKHGLAISPYTAKMLIADLRTGKYDFAFGVFSHLAYFSPDFDLSQFYLNEHFAFYVHCTTKKDILSFWSNYRNEFDTSIWACVGTVFFIVALILKVIATVLPKENPIFLSFWRNVFSLWAVHVDNNVEAKTKTLAMRVLVIALMFYCAIMTVAYRASLKSLLLTSWNVNSIRTWKELEQSNLSISGVPDMYTILGKISMRHKTLRKLKKRFKIITSNTLSNIVERVTIKKDTAYFGPESLIAFYNSLENEKNDKNKQNICQVNKIVGTSPASFFLMERGSIFLDMVNRVTNMMVQTGQMKQFAIPQVVKLASHNNIQDEQLPTSLQQLKGAFLLLLAGLVLAAVVFVLEILCERFKLGRLKTSRKEQQFEFIN